MDYSSIYFFVFKYIFNPYTLIFFIAIIFNYLIRSCSDKTSQEMKMC